MSTTNERFDRYGYPMPHLDTTDMSQPAQCTHCGRVYDLGTVEVTARYSDCSMWRSPCCNRLVDDRGETGWKSHGDYRRLDRR